MKLKQVLLNILLGTMLLVVGCNSAEQKSESEADTSEGVKESVVVETEIESTEWESETEESIKTVEIQCYVIDVDDEHSLTEVKVTAVDGDEKEYEVKTDEGGWFELLLPEGTYTLTFEKENYEREELYDIVVESGKDVDIPDRIKLKSSLDSTYILPESDSRVYDISEIQELATEQLELARNEIFARHGRKFQREDLKAYFNGKSWYQESIEPEDFDDNIMLSEIEKANLDLIRSVEEGTYYTGVVDVMDYMDNPETLINLLGMQANYDVSNFFSTEPLYEKENFALEYVYDSACERFESIMYNDGNQMVTILGVGIGDDIDVAYKKISEKCSMYIGTPYAYSNPENGVTGNHVSVDISYQGQVYFMEFSYDLNNKIVSWYVNSWYEGIPDEMLLRMLSVEDSFDKSQQDWQRAYIDYIKREGWGGDGGDLLPDIYYNHYYLAYINEDDIPELIQYGVGIAGTNAIVTYQNGQLYSNKITYNQNLGGTYFIERRNLILNYGGGGGLFARNIYQIADNQLVEIHHGDHGILNADDDILKYAWDGVEVSETEFDEKLNAVFDFSVATEIQYEQMVLADEIIRQILER